MPAKCQCITDFIKSHYKCISVLAFLAVALGAACYMTYSNNPNIMPKNKFNEQIQTTTHPTAQPTTGVGLANPASVNCADKGGTLQIVKRGDGGEYGICFFEDNRQCEEWALFRGECPVGGRKITGYENDEQVYCAITGGDVDMEKKTCTKAGQTCDLTRYYNGGCF